MQLAPNKRKGSEQVATRPKESARPRWYWWGCLLGQELPSAGLHEHSRASAPDLPREIYSHVPARVFGMLSVLAELQRELIVANARDGLAAARARGRRGGCPSKLSPDQVQLPQRLYDTETAGLVGDRRERRCGGAAGRRAVGGEQRICRRRRLWLGQSLGEGEC